MTLDFVFRKCTGRTPAQLMDSSDLDWYDGYANSREDSSKGILVADWNHFPRLLASSWPRTTESESAQQYNWNKGRRFQSILERMGYQLEWSDQVSRCGDCGKLIHTEPDSYNWQPEFHVFDGDIICRECILSDPSDYLSDIEDNPNNAVMAWIDPEDHGYELIRRDLENGFHPGQDDNPKAIYNRLKDQGYSGMLFRVDSTSQFSMRFSLYAREMPETSDETSKTEES